jgi:Tol biopolymer transport system component
MLQPFKLTQLSMLAHEDSGSIGKNITNGWIFDKYWNYSEPITIEKDNEIFDIYIMDSEGLGGVDKN